MWKKLILTAGSDSQNQVFVQQLAKVPIGDYAEIVEVVTDESPGIRIGSGGATLSVIRRSLENKTDEDLEKEKVLLLHSGGLSQRMPHLSAYGKVFCRLPNKKTILETKLNIYKNNLLEMLPQPGGIMITASDVIENMETGDTVSSDVDIVIFAHVSSLEVGTQHGVFVIDKKTNKLKRVLQKPTIDEMRENGAVREDGTVLTDSCYFMNWKFCKRLIEDPILRGPITEELCCYGDFMRPMGYDPKLDYIESSPSGIKVYRRALADIFKTAKVEVVTLGKKSFFHFGTYHEFIESLLPISDYRDSFPNEYSSNVIFSKGVREIPDSSFVEYSSGPFQVGNHSLISGIDSGTSEIELPSNTVIFTMALKKKNYVSIIIKIDDDIKKKCDRVRWNGHDTRIDGKSIWEAPIFMICESRNKSLEVTLDEWKNGIKQTETERVSMDDAMTIQDFEADLKWRSSFTSLQV